MNSKNMDERVLYNNGEVLTFLDKPVSFDTYLTKAIWKSYPDYINGSMLREERSGGGWFSSPSYTYWLTASNGEETAISRRRYDELSQRVIDQVASAEKKTNAILSKYEHELDLIAHETPTRRLKIRSCYTETSSALSKCNRIPEHAGKFERDRKADLWKYEAALAQLSFIRNKYPELDLSECFSWLSQRRQDAYQSCISEIKFYRQGTKEIFKGNASTGK